MRIDAHQHFWRYNPDEHVWMTEEMDILKRDYVPQDLQPLLRDLGALSRQEQGYRHEKH
ncbi:MAG: hypothetical protein GY801_36855 [bacterium]|nr:hypothetical protein [bacterium]